MTRIDNKRKLDEIVIKKLQDILYENKELLNTYNFKNCMGTIFIVSHYGSWYNLDNT